MLYVQFTRVYMAVPPTNVVVFRKNGNEGEVHGNVRFLHVTGFVFIHWPVWVSMFQPPGRNSKSKENIPLFLKRISGSLMKFWHLIDT